MTFTSRRARASPRAQEAGPKRNRRAGNASSSFPSGLAHRSLTARAPLRTAAIDPSYSTARSPSASFLRLNARMPGGAPSRRARRPTCSKSTWRTLRHLGAFELARVGAHPDDPPPLLHGPLYAHRTLPSSADSHIGGSPRIQCAHSSGPRFTHHSLQPATATATRRAKRRPGFCLDKHESRSLPSPPLDGTIF